MTQLVFIHGIGAGGCSDCYVNQLKHFPDAVAPNLPGHPDGVPCADVSRYTDWLRGWLWARGMRKDLVLYGFTLGAAIALQYALDYPDEVKGVVASTIWMKPGPGTDTKASADLRLRAARGDEAAYKEWTETHRKGSLRWIEPELREKLIARHREMGPLIGYHDIVAYANFDVSPRISSLKPKLLLVRGGEDHRKRAEYEKEIHELVAGSRLVTIEKGAGHFPATERPDEVNRLIEEFVASLSP